MKFYLGVTDNNWYKYLSDINPEDINFWQPEVVQKNGTLFCIKNAENGSKENQEITRTL